MWKPPPGPGDPPRISPYPSRPCRPRRCMARIIASRLQLGATLFRAHCPHDVECVGYGRHVVQENPDREEDPPRRPGSAVKDQTEVPPGNQRDAKHESKGRDLADPSHIEPHPEPEHESGSRQQDEAVSN